MKGNLNMENSGYCGYSRSVRSQEAINNYEVPVSLITKDLIKDFISDNKDYLSFEYATEEIEKLNRFSVGLWKYACKSVTPSSWHHTSSHYNKTNHYDLCDIAEYIIMTENIEERYKQFKEFKQSKNNKLKFSYGVIEVAIFSDSIRNPRFLRYEREKGIVIGDWLYYSYADDSISKYKISSKKCNCIWKYDNYQDLVNHFPEYKKTKRYFNKLIKQKTK